MKSQVTYKLQLSIVIALYSKITNEFWIHVIHVSSDDLDR